MEMLADLGLKVTELAALTYVLEAVDHTLLSKL